jgi:hypothetical protein
MLSDRDVSVFPSARVTLGATMRINSFLFNEKGIEPLLAIRAEKDKAKRSRLKEQIPCMTPSAIIQGNRSAANVVSHTGLIAFDIDSKDNPCYADYMEFLRDHLPSVIPHLIYAGLSVSGTGVWGLIECEPSIEKHKTLFKAVQDLFLTASTPIIIDRGPSNIASLRYYSYDPYAVVLCADPLTVDEAEAITMFSEQEYAKKTYEYNPSDTRDKVEQVIARAKLLTVDMTYDYVSEWFPIAMSLASEFGQAGEDYFDQISQLSTKYDQTTVRRQYAGAMRNARNGSYSIATFFYIAKRYNLY